jgi:KDO2-lipid IV(A) lauroyltransferase|tara:strand:+ start:3838 stop:4698 length:861 start_codon:yes stop_codon:yes gene_type:complete
MKIIKYLIEFVLIGSLFIIFKLIGLKNASNLGAFLGKFIGPTLRSKKTIISNINKTGKNFTKYEIKLITKKMWSNYGRILSEYMFIKKFRFSSLESNISVEGQEILEEIKKNNEPVLFISGHFNNFELMAMHIEKSGINLAAIYRPLNNFFLNFIIEKIRRKYICKKQIKKGRMSVRQLLSLFKQKYSIALMIDQRVTEGIRSDFFGQKALTTTIPAQFVKKFNCRVVPIYIERKNGIKFKIVINKPIHFSKEESITSITDNLNKWLEGKVLQNPEQWIWSHDRWK